ncbi:non-heme iron oxygenase ferredoxin subunit [Georgenia sp. M64]|uniref:non-heme iron oxygenase ferredoxin subunit n=1 Tax=Georgenia sp. M64 TaxID=3120520 RepID=UPI0030E19572
MSAQHACDTGDLEPGEAMRLDLEDTDGRSLPVALVRDEDGDFHAISDICSHGQVSLSDGEVEGCAIECWLHGSTFDLRTGRPLSLPATQPVPVYPVTLDGPRVLVDVDAPVDVPAR